MPSRSMIGRAAGRPADEPRTFERNSRERRPLQQAARKRPFEAARQ
jgi:hypothetical protein